MPGWAATNLQGRSGNRIEHALVAGIGNRLLAQSGDMGALPTLFAATQDIPGDTYIGPDGPGELRGYPTVVGRSAAAQDREVARRLWDESERLTGVSFPQELSALAH